MSRMLGGIHGHEQARRRMEVSLCLRLTAHAAADVEEQAGRWLHAIGWPAWRKSSFCSLTIVTAVAECGYPLGCGSRVPCLCAIQCFPTEPPDRRAGSAGGGRSGLHQSGAGPHRVDRRQRNPAARSDPTDEGIGHGGGADGFGHHGVGDIGSSGYHPVQGTASAGAGFTVDKPGHTLCEPNKGDPAVRSGPAGGPGPS